MFKKPPFITVIIPTLNEEKYLPRLLKDLASQTYSDFEVIHVDGNSDDDTQKLAKSVGKNIKSFSQITTKVRNVAHQRNLGGNKAKGTYLLFIDADTQLPHFYLEGLAYQLHKKPTDTFTTWSVADSDKPADKAYVTVVNLGLEAGNLIDSPFAIGVLLGSTKRAFDAIGGFREDVKFGEDEDYIKDAFDKGLSFRVYRNPRFIYSLRRFRTEGTLPTLQNLASKKLKAINGGKPLIKPVNYKMGGHVFEKKTDQAIFNRLDQVSKLFGKRPKLKKFLQDLITFQDLDA